MLCLLVFVTLLIGARGASDVESIRSQGYPAEVHNVTTDDGYILGVQRIPYGKKSINRTSPRKVAFLMHGLIAGSNSYIYIASGYSIAYNLADAGYDVWMGNARGNSYSRRHVSLDPDKDKFKFFDFTYEEIALYDLPAMIDYILKTTKQKKLHYIGHSQGGTVFFVLNSMKTAYQTKFASAHLLSGVGYQEMFPNKILKLLSPTIDVIHSVTLLAGIVEFKSTSVLSQLLINFALKTMAPPELIAGCAVKQVVHFFQNIRDEKFVRYNFGAVVNLVKYGTISPPSYDLSKINVNVTLHYSLGDLLQSEGDTLAMAKVMPNARARKVPRDDFGHLDYVVSEDVKALVTDHIIESFDSS